MRFHSEYRNSQSPKERKNMYQEFTLSSLTNFADGKVAISFNKLLRAAVADCMDRSGETAAREVDLCIRVVPNIDQDGMTENVNVSVKIGSKVPKYQSAPVNCTSKVNGQLFFNDLSPDNPLQMTMDEHES